MRRFHWFEITLIAIIMGVHVYAAFSAPHNFSMRWFTRDDAYYYFKVAQNIVEGHGSTFDGINLANGYHPLWMAICIPIFALARFDLILPLRILLLLTAAISAVTSILLFRLLRNAFPEPVAILGASFWGLSMAIHDIVVQPGMETNVAALSIVTLLYLLQKFDKNGQSGTISLRHVTWLGLAAVFVLFSRLDSVYLALIVGVWVIFRRTPIRYLLPADLLTTFVVIVLAYIQRAELKIYFLVFADSAIITAAITFIIQTIAFYFVGLYQHPKNYTIPNLVRKSLLGATISALVSGLVMGVVTAIGLVDLPRAVLPIYWAAILVLTFLSRLLVRAISPWPPPPSNQVISPLGQLRQVWKRWLTEGTIYYGILGGALGAYMLFNKWMFGTFVPVSGQVKQWWGSLPNNVYGGPPKNILDLFAIDPVNSQAWRLFTGPLRLWVADLPKSYGHFENIYWTILLAIVAVWLVLFLLNRAKNLRRLSQTALIPLFISAELQAFLYGAMAYASEQEWYWSMQMIALIILGALALSNIVEILPRRRATVWATWAVSSGLSIYLAVTFAVTIYNRMPYQDAWAGQPYMDMLPILEGYTEPGAVIGMTGGGNAGYFIKDRTIVNMDGLINSYAYFRAVQEGKAGEYLRKMGMKYVFGNYYILTETMPYHPNLNGQLQEIPDTPAYGNKELLKLLTKK